MDPDPSEPPGRRLRRLLDERWEGLEKDFAVRVGISPEMLSKLKSGDTLRRSKPATRAAIAQLLDVSEAFLLYGSDSAPEGSEAERVRAEKLSAAKWMREMARRLEREAKDGLRSHGDPVERARRLRQEHADAGEDIGPAPLAPDTKQRRAGGQGGQR